MSPETDFFIAYESNARDVAASLRPVNIYPGLEMKDIDVVKLTRLHAILTGETWESLLSQYPLLAQRSRSGPWVVLIPESLIARLADLGGDRLHEVATQWAAIEEFKADRWTESAVRDALDKVTQLAREATAQGKRVLLKMTV